MSQSQLLIVFFFGSNERTEELGSNKPEKVFLRVPILRSNNHERDYYAVQCGHVSSNSVFLVACSYTYSQNETTMMHKWPMTNQHNGNGNGSTSISVRLISNKPPWDIIHI